VALTVYVAAADGFTRHAAVADGASAALREALGERGVVARTAVGVRTLPSGAPVEVALVAAVRPAPPDG
jgi:enamine deaminase RidA (YjgF/YER057c/UK114 family)